MPGERITRAKAAPRGTVTSRKELRKEARRLKKVGRAAYAQHTTLDTVLEEEREVERKKAAKREKRRRQRETKREREREKEEADNEEEVLGEIARETRKRQHEQVREEDAMAKKYAKKLGYNKRKSKSMPGIFIAEGLDYILEMCERGEQRAELAQKDLDEEKAAEKKKGNKKKATPVHKDEEMMEEDEDEDGEMSDEQASTSDIDEEEADGVDDEEEADGVDDEEEADDEEEEEMEMEDDEEDEQKEDEKETGNEDIYGRKVDAAGKLLQAGTREGALRKLREIETKVDAEQKRVLDRTCTGCINRLNEQTLVKSERDLVELWSSQPKNDVKLSLTSALRRAISAPHRVQDALLHVYAVLTAMLHKSTTGALSAHIVESLVLGFVEKTTSDRGDLDSGAQEDDKSTQNMAVFIADLLNFRIVRASLVLDVVGRLLKTDDGKLTADRMQLVSIIISYGFRSLRRSVGANLQTVLSEIAKTLERQEYQNEARLRFIGDQLGTLRKGAFPTWIDESTLDRFQALARGLIKTKGDAGTEKELAMTLVDLENAEERGRWWIVGSAWTGNVNEDEDDEETTEKPTTRATNKQQQQRQLNFAPELLALAARAKMSTAVRRNVFCTIVSSSSEDEAFERLVKLGLRGQQEREIVHILVALALKEKSTNPFYPTLIDLFCAHHKQFRLTTQYALWDRAREIAALPASQHERLGKLMAAVLQRRTLNAAQLLKVFDFGSLSQAAITCLRALTEELQRLGGGSAEHAISILKTALDADGSDNRALADGLRLFLQLHGKGRIKELAEQMDI